MPFGGFSMLDIVVYAGSMYFIEKYICSINTALSNYIIDYRIHKFVSCNDEFNSIIKSSGKKIYVIDKDADKVSGLGIASKIRNYDWDSVIIITTSFNCNDDLRLMILDIVDKYNEKRFIDDIKTAISIIEGHKIFNFKYNNVIYRIPYNHICYIEKESNIKRCIIHTINGKYYIIDSIDSILSRLNSSFHKTHQSCIVNLSNVSRIDLSTNMIVFKNGDSTGMLTVKMKREVKKYLGIS